MRTTTNYLHTSAKESIAKWAAIRNAAGVLEAVVYDMAQAVTNADGEKLLRAKREAVSASISYAQVAESLDQLRTMQFYGARVADSYTELAQWFAVLQGATTFARWEECRGHIIRLRAVFYTRYHAISDYATNYINLSGELVVHYRKELAKENKKRTPPVAVPKAVRKEAIIDRTNKMVHTKYVPDIAKSYYVTAQTPNAVLYGRLRELNRYSSDKLQYASASASRLCNDMAKVDGRYSTTYLITTAQEVHRLYVSSRPAFLARLP